MVAPEGCKASGVDLPTALGKTLRDPIRGKTKVRHELDHPH